MFFEVYILSQGQFYGKYVEFISFKINGSFE